LAAFSASFAAGDLTHKSSRDFCSRPIVSADVACFIDDAQDFIERRHLPFTNQALRLLLKLNLVGLLCDNLGLSPVIIVFLETDEKRFLRHCQNFDKFDFCFASSNIVASKQSPIRPHSSSLENACADDDIGIVRSAR